MSTGVSGYLVGAVVALAFVSGVTYALADEILTVEDLPPSSDRASTEVQSTAAPVVSPGTAVVNTPKSDLTRTTPSPAVLAMTPTPTQIRATVIPLTVAVAPPTRPVPTQAPVYAPPPVYVPPLSSPPTKTAAQLLCVFASVRGDWNARATCGFGGNTFSAFEVSVRIPIGAKPERLEVRVTAPGEIGYSWARRLYPTDGLTIRFDYPSDFFLTPDMRAGVYVVEVRDGFSRIATGTVEFR